MTQSRSDFELLMQFATAELSAADRQRLEARMASDGALRTRAERLRGVVAAMRSDNSIAPPPHAVERAYGIFESKAPAAAGSLWSQLKQVIAEIVFDSRVQPALSGYRGSDEGYQVSYAVPGGDVDIEVRPDADAAGHWSVIGQVSVADSEPIAVALRASGAAAPLLESMSDRQGVFRLRTDQVGSFELCLRLGGELLVLPRIELG